MPLTLTLDRATMVNLLTLIIVGVWIVMAIVRIWVPIPSAAILDAAMPIVIGFWFATGAMAKKEETAHDQP